MGNDTTNAVKKFAKDLSKAPAPKQMAVGATAGWLAGYLTMKVGKAAATMVGGSLLVLQIAHHKGKWFRYIKDRVRTKCAGILSYPNGNNDFVLLGYVKVNWQQLSNDCAAAADKTKASLSKKGKVMWNPKLLITCEIIYG